jgi:hypothetical protein
MEPNVLILRNPFLAQEAQDDPIRQDGWRAIADGAKSIAPIPSTDLGSPHHRYANHSAGDRIPPN